MISTMSSMSVGVNLFGARLLSNECMLSMPSHNIFGPLAIPPNVLIDSPADRIN